MRFRLALTARTVAFAVPTAAASIPEHFGTPHVDATDPPVPYPRPFDLAGRSG